MFFKGFLTFFVILFSVCLMALIFFLASLPEARFDLSENKAFNREELSCGFTPSYAVVFSNEGTKTYKPAGSGFLRLVTATEIQENEWGKELVAKTEPLWMFVFFSCVSITFFTFLGIKEIFRRR
jgi:hypothetical protein